MKLLLVHCDSHLLQIFQSNTEHMHKEEYLDICIYVYIFRIINFATNILHKECLEIILLPVLNTVPSLFQ